MSGKKVSGTKWCAYCGTQAPSGAVFCPRCGEPIDPSHVFEEINSEEALVKKEKESGESYEIPPIQSISSTPGGYRTRVLYEGMIRGLVTGESKLIRTPVEGVRSTVAPNPNMFLPAPYYGFAEAYFVMRLEENIEGVPDEILVFTSKFGYFGVGDEVTLQGKIIKEDLGQWGRPMYIIFADHYYNESLQIGDEESKTRKQVLYKGVIRGLVTKESRLRFVGGGRIFGADFVMKLEENIEGVPEEILVHTAAIGYFRKDDEVILQGRIFKIVLRQWGRPMYVIEADHFHNESLQIGDKSGWNEYVLYGGTLRGTVTGESRSSFTKGNFIGTYFVLKLEENIGIGEIPDEILAYNTMLFRFGVAKSGYFGMGDKVILLGKIIKIKLKLWDRLMYVIEADHYYNESLQIGDEGFMEETYVSNRIMMRGLVTKESRSNVRNDGKVIGIYFAVKLEENIGIEGIPDEILVRSDKLGYFRIGDEVTLQGKIFKINLKRWGRPMYVIEAEHFYNESLQIGD
nr:zinc ribbon domain-containing protein [Candidatus Freyarchaeota archaeon]